MIFAMVTWIKQEFALRPTNPAEREVADALKLLGEQFKVLNNLILEGESVTNHSQVDHVIVSNYGIFCIETKQHKGIIIPRKNDKNWVQFIGKNQQYIANPLFRNYSLVKTLDTYIAKSGIRLQSSIKSLVVFPFATKIMHKHADTFGNLSDVVSYIDSHRTAVYTDEERDAIYVTLRHASASRYSVIAKHAQQAKTPTL